MRCSHRTTVKWYWLKNIEFYSLCEHHLLPFYGRVHIAYLPEGNVLGLSKFARITEMFARRLQIQENLTQQIAEAVAEVTGARGVAVMIDSAHMCMMMRGVGKQESTTRTVSFIGDFKTNKEERREFLSAAFHHLKKFLFIVGKLNIP